MPHHVLEKIALLAVFCLAPPAIAAERIAVLTSYPEEVFARFEAAFEAANPDLDVTIVWRMPHDALPYLRGPGRGHVDVYWAAAYRNFATLAREDALSPLAADRSALPENIGTFRLAGPHDMFAAVEMAGFGLAFHPGHLASLGLPAPSEWSDVADPRYEGHVLLPVPSRVGFAPTLVDGILQGHGWQRGWDLLQRIAANARLVTSGATFLTEELVGHRGAVALGIDFFTRSAIANGSPLEFRYPSTGGLSFAQVAVLRDAPKPAPAARFASFLLSPEGQALLLDRDIRKMPVRPDVYVEDDDTWNPFTNDAPILRYDPDLGVQRAGLVAALFDALITDRHERAKSAWSALRDAKRRLGPDAPVAERTRLARVERMLCALPVSAAQARDPRFAARFDRRTDPDAAAGIAEITAGWRAFFDRQTDEAMRALVD